MRVLPLIFGGFLCLALPTAPIAAQGKSIVGWVEKVRFYPGDLVVHAKLDTGAKTSSLNASQVTEFERRRERWVRFEVVNRDGDRATLERKVVRIAKIKRPAEKSQERLVILLGICLGNIHKEAEVNLAERTGLTYQMLIGRNFMEGHLIVDSSLTYTTEPHCEGASPP